MYREEQCRYFPLSDRTGNCHVIGNFAGKIRPAFVLEDAFAYGHTVATR